MLLSSFSDIAWENCKFEGKSGGQLEKQKLS